MLDKVAPVSRPAKNEKLQKQSPIWLAIDSFPSLRKLSNGRVDISPSNLFEESLAHILIAVRNTTHNYRATEAATLAGERAYNRLFA